MICINLLEVFGNRFRVTFDAAYSARYVPHAKLDAWMTELPCQGNGVVIYPHGNERLAVEVNRRPSIVAKLKAIDGLTLHQDGDNEKTFLFDVSLFEQVAAVVKPRRKRRITEERRQELASYGRQYGFGAKKSALGHARTTVTDSRVTNSDLPLFSLAES